MQPSFATGFATNASFSAAPNQWRGLVGAWAPFLGIQGGMLYDHSGFGHHGTLTNMDLAAVWVMDRDGYALLFDGTDDHVLIAHGSMFDFLGQDFTICHWIKPNSVTKTQMLVNKKNLGSTAAGYTTFISNTGVVSAALGDGTTNIVGAGSTPALSTWTHIAVVFSQTTGAMNIYQDGILTSTSSISGVTGNITNAITLRLSLRNDTVYFDGRMNDIRIYNRALSIQEIASIRADPFAMYRRPRMVRAGVSVLEQVAYRWRHDDGSLAA